MNQAALGAKPAGGMAGQKGGQMGGAGAAGAGKGGAGAGVGMGIGADGSMEAGGPSNAREIGTGGVAFGQGGTWQVAELKMAVKRLRSCYFAEVSYASTLLHAASRCFTLLHATSRYFTVDRDTHLN